MQAFRPPELSTVLTKFSVDATRLELQFLKTFRDALILIETSYGDLRACQGFGRSALRVVKELETRLYTFKTHFSSLTLYSMADKMSILINAIPMSPRATQIARFTMMQYIGALQTGVKTVLTIQCALLKASLISARLVIAVKKVKLHALQVGRQGSCACSVRMLPEHQAHISAITALNKKLLGILRGSIRTDPDQ